MELTTKKALLRENPEQFQKELINYYVIEVSVFSCYIISLEMFMFYVFREACKGRMLPRS